MPEFFTIYKLIILYMLSKVSFPLTNNQISSFLLEGGYTNYFTLQQAFSELLESKLVKIETIRNTTQYRITEAGSEALSYFGSRIPSAIKEDALQYLRDHKIELLSEVSVVADYLPITGGEFTVRCRVKEKESDLMDLTLRVPDETEAEAICRTWKKKCESVYRYLISELTSD